MTRTHKKAAEEVVSRLTGSASHQHDATDHGHDHGHDHGTDHGTDQGHDHDHDHGHDGHGDGGVISDGGAFSDGDADTSAIDADPREIDGILDEADTAARGDADTDGAAPVVVTGQAPEPPTGGLYVSGRAAASGGALYVSGGALIEPPPPVESYEQLLGGLGERPFDSPRPLTPEAAWGRSLRLFARAAIWALPAAAVCVALSGMWGWPTRAAEPSGESPGTWLAVTVAGLVLGLIGVVALTALLSSTPGRRWSLVALVATLAGIVLLAPILGVLGLARPTVTRASGRLGPSAAAELDTRFLDNPVSHWLGTGGLVLLGVGWLAMGCAILSARILNRVDGYLLLSAVVIGVAAAYLSWQFLITVAALVFLAAGLGLSWTAVRLSPDGRAPVDD